MFPFDAIGASKRILTFIERRREMISKMRKSCLLVIGALLLGLTGSATKSEAAVNINVGEGSISRLTGLLLRLTWL